MWGTWDSAGFAEEGFGAEEGYADYRDGDEACGAPPKDLADTLAPTGDEARRAWEAFRRAFGHAPEDRGDAARVLRRAQLCALERAHPQAATLLGRMREHLDDGPLQGYDGGHVGEVEVGLPRDLRHAHVWMTPVEFLAHVAQGHIALDEESYPDYIGAKRLCE